MQNVTELIEKQHLDHTRTYENLLTKRYIENKYGKGGLRYLLNEIQKHYDSLIRSYKQEVIETHKEKEFTNGFDAWSLLKVSIDMKHAAKLRQINRHYLDR
jgi:hypothetical protein